MIYCYVWEGYGYLTSTCPLLAQRKQTTLGVIGTEVRIPKPPISHTFSASQSSCGKQERPFRNIKQWSNIRLKVGGGNIKLKMPELPRLLHIRKPTQNSVAFDVFFSQTQITMLHLFLYYSYHCKENESEFAQAFWGFNWLFWFEDHPGFPTRLWMDHMHYLRPPSGWGWGASMLCHLSAPRDPWQHWPELAHTLNPPPSSSG